MLSQKETKVCLEIYANITIWGGSKKYLQYEGEIKGLFLFFIGRPNVIAIRHLDGLIGFLMMTRLSVTLNYKNDLHFHVFRFYAIF